MLRFTYYPAPTQYLTLYLIPCSRLPKPASLRDAGFAARVVVLGCGFSCARVWFFENCD